MRGRKGRRGLGAGRQEGKTLCDFSVVPCEKWGGSGDEMVELCSCIGVALEEVICVSGAGGVREWRARTWGEAGRVLAMGRGVNRRAV